MEVNINNTKLVLVQEDITKQDTQAIVNAANSSLMGGGGVDGAIHKAAGLEILEECKKIRSTQGKCPTGEAVITTGGNLESEYIIHTVGPVWEGNKNNEAQLLKNCYINSLEIAKKYNIKSISFPSISTGVYGYPIEKASQVALSAIIEYINNCNQIEEIRVVLFSVSDYETYKFTLSNLL